MACFHRLVVTCPVLGALLIRNDNVERLPQRLVLGESEYSPGTGIAVTDQIVGSALHHDSGIRQGQVFGGYERPKVT